MSVHWTCDYCGGKIDTGRGWARVRIDGWGIDLTDGSSLRLDEVHFYCASYEGSCYRRVNGALLEVDDQGPAIELLEAIPTVSHQAISAKRRKHRKGGEA